MDKDLMVNIYEEGNIILRMHYKSAEIILITQEYIDSFRCMNLKYNCEDFNIKQGPYSSYKDKLIGRLKNKNKPKFTDSFTMDDIYYVTPTPRDTPVYAPKNYYREEVTYLGSRESDGDTLSII